jgi:peroxin-2
LITNPYCGECGHAYCYTCLLGEVAGEEGDGWSCLRCGTVIKHVERWKEFVGEEIPTEENKEAKTEVGDKEGSSEEGRKVEEAVTPESEEVEEEDSGDANSEEGQNLFR